MFVFFLLYFIKLHLCRCMSLPRTLPCGSVGGRHSWFGSAQLLNTPQHCFHTENDWNCSKGNTSNKPCLISWPTLPNTPAGDDSSLVIVYFGFSGQMRCLPIDRSVFPFFSHHCPAEGGGNWKRVILIQSIGEEWRLMDLRRGRHSDLVTWWNYVGGFIKIKIMED